MRINLHRHSSLSSFLWGLSGAFLGVYVVVQNLNIPLILQPQLFGILCMISWAQVCRNSVVHFHQMFLFALTCETPLCPPLIPINISHVFNSASTTETNALYPHVYWRSRLWWLCWEVLRLVWFMLSGCVVFHSQCSLERTFFVGLFLT